MNKNIFFTLFLVCNIAIMTMLTVVPVHAYTYYHGYTSNWDRGGGEGTPSWSTSYEYDTSTGELGAAAPGTAYAYLNSAHVDAIADVSSITVTAFFEDGSIYSFFGVYSMECRLYVNSQYQGTQEASFNTWNNGFEDFTFTDLDIDTNDDLDVDIWFWAIASGIGTASISAELTYVAFTTD